MSAAAMRQARAYDVAEIFDEKVERGGKHLVNEQRRGGGVRSAVVGLQGMARARTIASISATASISVAMT